MLRLCKRWEAEHGVPIDFVLQVGDFGVWPEPWLVVDEATRRFAEKDPDEISFPEYSEATEESVAFFADDGARRFSAQVFFVKGNHEDFEYLDRYRYL